MKQSKQNYKKSRDSTEEYQSWIILILSAFEKEKNYLCFTFALVARLFFCIWMRHIPSTIITDLLDENQNSFVILSIVFNNGIEMHRMFNFKWGIKKKSN